MVRVSQVMSLNLGFLFFLLWSSPVLAGCPVDFEHQNYTIITTKCKAPYYPVNLCCAAFLEFACPFSNEINDVSNNCAETMFSYINSHGNYPAALFSSECRGDKKGLSCDGISNNQTASESGRQQGANKAISMMSIVILAAVLAS